jgi:hypothetical protein
MDSRASTELVSAEKWKWSRATNRPARQEDCDEVPVDPQKSPKIGWTDYTEPGLTN